jgi:uncharacterized membrane protein YhaH (DUF805 family)
MTRALTPFRKYAKFSGRSRRREFWPFAITAVFIVLVTSVVMPPLGALIGCLVFIPLSSCAVRRLHDIGRSGSWLIPLIAIPACMIIVFAIGLSILGVVLVAALGIETSPSQYEDGIRLIETALAWTFAVYLVLMLVMASWTGSQASNQFGEL